MRRRVLALIVGVSCLIQHVSGQWTTPLLIGSGGHDDTHPSFVNSPFMFSWNEELLAFSRKDNIIDVNSICVLRTTGFGQQWSDSLTTVVTDSVAVNDYPVLARAITDTSLLLLWERTIGDKKSIYYSSGKEGIWSVPAPIDTNSHSDCSAFAAAVDSGFGAVWVREGRIIFSEFLKGEWAPVQEVSLHTDTMNFSPQLRYLGYPGFDSKVFAIWEHMTSLDTSREIVYAIRHAGQWSVPRSFTSSGDNRNPRFFRPDVGGELEISWESNRNGTWQIFGSLGYIIHDTLQWDLQDSPLELPPGWDYRDGSFAVVPIITTRQSPNASFPWFVAGTARATRDSGDAIVTLGGGSFPTFFRACDSSVNRHPALSSGVGENPFRVWSVWESNCTGHWNLYGSSVDIILGVKDQGAIPVSFSLGRNFPNPFNSSTSISYTVPKQIQVRLQVYNVLGQLVKTLVNQDQLPGSYTVTWDAGERSSGVFFYTMQAGAFTRTEKMLYLR
jgi:type IX secretion system substrate protein